MTGLVVLRPEPGNSATAARARALGLKVLQQPLFAVEPVAWTPPDPAGFDGLLLTSANAARHAGPGLAALAALPVVAVGSRTADAARAAGLRVAIVGDADAAAAVVKASALGLTRLLHLAGRDHRDVGMPTMVVYASVALEITATATASWQGRTLLLHSPRAARRVVTLVDRDARDRARISIAAISARALATAGQGWCATGCAETPADAALLQIIPRLTACAGAGISGS